MITGRSGHDEVWSEEGSEGQSLHSSAGERERSVAWSRARVGSHALAVRTTSADLRVGCLPREVGG